MNLLQKIFSIIPTIIAIAWLLSILGVNWKKHLKEFFRTEERPSNHKQEIRKIQAEINKSKTKSEKS